MTNLEIIMAISLALNGYTIVRLFSIKWNQMKADEEIIRDVQKAIVESEQKESSREYEDTIYDIWEDEHTFNMEQGRLKQKRHDEIINLIEEIGK